MFENIENRIFTETNLLFDDKPHLFEQIIDNPQELANWKSITNCLNSPQFYNFEIIDKHNQKVHIPQNNKVWVYEKQVQEKSFMFEKVSEGNSLVISNYTFANDTVNELMKTFERLFDVHAAGHLYCGLSGSESFSIHDDYPVNFIIQIEGTTKWKVFKNKISYLYRTGIMNGKLIEDNLEVAIECDLKPGDMLYIPSRTFHVAYPKEQRISLSVPCWNKLPSDLPTTALDRNIYNIQGVNYE